MQKTQQPQVHLKTRKSQPIQQKIRNDFYCFDSSPRFFMRQKIYNPSDNKSLTRLGDKSNTSPSNFDSLFQRSSPDGFAPDWKTRKRSASPNRQSPETPKFTRGKKKYEYKPVSESKKADFMIIEPKTGKKCLKFASPTSLEKVQGLAGKVVAYKNLSRIFEGVREPNNQPFESEYSKSFRHHGPEAYRNEAGPFMGGNP